MTKSAKLPQFVAYAVGGEGRNESWTRVGAAWKHDRSEGYTIKINPGVAITGKIVLRPPKDDDAQE